MKIPFLSLSYQNQIIEADIKIAFENVFHISFYILGKEVEKFEKNYSIFNKIKHCIGVGNGLDALVISLRALGIGEGDEVIVPSNTYVASLLAVSAVGAIPVIVEPRIDTYNINPNFIEEKIFY